MAVVSIFRPFWGDYWIIELGEHHEYDVVGHPSRDHLWILSRTRTMAPERYDAIIGQLKAVGNETDHLKRTPQPIEG